MGRTVWNYGGTILGSILVSDEYKYIVSPEWKSKKERHPVWDASLLLGKIVGGDCSGSLGFTAEVEVPYWKCYYDIQRIKSQITAAAFSF